MAQVMLLVINRRSKVEDVIYEWIDAGVRGVTVFDSHGWAQRLGSRRTPTDTSRLRSVRALLAGPQPENRTILSVVHDDFDIPMLIERTEKILGRLDGSGRGIFVAFQASHVAGLGPEEG